MLLSIKQHYIKNEIETLRIPVIPSTYGIKSSKNSNSITLLGFGEINDTGTPTLKAWSISSFFPNHDYSFVQGKRKSNVWDYVSLIERIKDENAICTYVITKTSVNILCTIEEFEYSEQDGTGDIYYTITFKEHKKISLSTINNAGTATNVLYFNSDYTLDTTKENKTQVRKNETLPMIAKRVYGDSSEYTTIMDKNDLKNVNDIREGQVLLL